MNRKTTILTSLAIAALAFSSWSALAAETPDLADVLSRKPALRPFTPQQPKRILLPNGMLILLQEDRELPLIQGYALIRGGSRDEPAEKVGLVELFGDAWRTGGSKATTGDALDDYLEAKAAKVETWGGLTSTGLSFNCLKERFEDTFKVAVELLLQEPAFPQEKVDLARTQMNTGIARRNDNPDGIASREIRRIAYGHESPYGRIPEYATAAAVTREDLVKWHKTYVVPNNIVMAVWGDFDTAKMEVRLKQAFGKWPKGAAATKKEGAFPGPTPGVYFVAKEDVTQSKIQLAHMGARRDSPDFFALEVMNELFGGGFSSRLMTNVRAKKGLAYGVWGRVGMQYDYPGLFNVGMATKSEGTVVGVEALLEEIDGLLKEPPSSDELQKAKDGILNSFVFRLDSKEKIVQEKVNDAFYGYPSDLLERYQAGIAKVTAADVHRVAKQYVHKDKLAILVVGKASAFDKPLSSLGTVTPIDITIPSGQPKSKAAEAQSSDDAGKALLAKVAAGLGGEAKAKAQKVVRTRGTAVVPTPQGEMSMAFVSTEVAPDRVHVSMKTPMGEMVQVMTPDAGFMSMMGQVRDLPASIRQERIAMMALDPTAVIAAGDAGLVVVAKGTEKVGEIEGSVLVVKKNGKEVRWVVDPKTGCVIRTVAQVTGPQGPAEEVSDYSDFRPVDGVPMAHQVQKTTGGQPGEKVTVEAIELNPELDPKLFEKPAMPAAQK